MNLSLVSSVPLSGNENLRSKPKKSLQICVSVEQH